MPPSRLRRFLHATSGAISVDWVALVAVGAGMAIAAASVLTDATRDVTATMRSELNAPDPD